MSQRHPLKQTWYAMMHRCYKPGHLNYHRYGRRGIIVCERWHTFTNFANDMGVRPEGLTLDRIDNDGNYCPENCRWATKAEQMANRSNAVFLSFGDDRHKLMDLVATTGIHPNTLMGRYEKGLSFQEVIQPERIKRAPETFTNFIMAGSKGRSEQLKSMTHCVNGHEFTPENTAYIGERMKRRCRECHRSRMRKYNEEAKNAQ